MFNGFYTLISPHSGEHRTFRVRTQDEKDNFAPGERLIALLKGPDNESDYRNFGYVTDRGIRVWSSVKAKADGGFFESCAKILWDVAENGAESYYAKKGWRVELDKRCRRCNRRLTNPVSLESGIGPECAERMAQ